jgi:hypothetical protein
MYTLTLCPSNPLLANETVLVFRHLFHSAAFLLQLKDVTSLPKFEGGWSFEWNSTSASPEQVIELMKQCHKPLMEIKFPHLIGKGLYCNIQGFYQVF